MQQNLSTHTGESSPVWGCYGRGCEFKEKESQHRNAETSAGENYFSCSRERQGSQQVKLARSRGKPLGFS